MAKSMIDTKEFSEMKTELEEFDRQREEIIKQSRDILRDSKKAIYSVHRDEMKDAATLLAGAKKGLQNIKKSIGKNTRLDFLGALSAATQEYAEAECFYRFVKDGKVPSRKELDAQAEDYLLGLCDLTGELGRRAVNLAIKAKKDDVETIRELVGEIHGLFLGLDLRNSELRKKSDSIKWNLKKIEEVCYDLSLKR